MSRIGFILITHNNPAQVRRLIGRLNVLYDVPPIIQHHDFDQTPLDADDFPPNVCFIRPSLATRWGDYSVVRAMLGAMELAVARDADWYVVLSGADYPLKPAEVVLRDLETGGADAYLHLEPIALRNETHPWRLTCHRRYVLRTELSRRHASNVAGALLRRAGLRRPNEAPSPFSETFGCFAGSQWMSLNRRALEEILDFAARRPDVGAYYRATNFPEESYFHTILGNAAQLKIHPENHRCIAWNPGEPHPQTLTMADLPALRVTQAHFARKFDVGVDATVLDAIDEFVG